MCRKRYAPQRTWRCKITSSVGRWDSGISSISLTPPLTPTGRTCPRESFFFGRSAQPDLAEGDQVPIGVLHPWAMRPLGHAQPAWLHPRGAHAASQRSTPCPESVTFRDKDGGEWRANAVWFAGG